MVGPLRKVVSQFWPNSRIEGWEPHHHVEVARRWCKKSVWRPAETRWCKESLSQQYKAFIRPVLSYVYPGWYPFLYDTLKKELKVYHRSACRVIFGCLASTPVPLLLVELQSPAGNHAELGFPPKMSGQEISCFEISQFPGNLCRDPRKFPVFGFPGVPGNCLHLNNTALQYC